MFGDDDDEDTPPAKPAAAATQTLTVETVLKELPVLRTCIAGAESIVPPGRLDRIVLISPLLHLHFLEQKNPSIRVGSEEFLGGNRVSAEKAVEIAALWGKLADRLAPPNTPNPAPG